LDDFRDLAPADLFLVATPDNVVGEVAARLAGSGLAGRHTVTFHLGGALESRLLTDAGVSGPVASVHPLRSFGDFEQSVQGFAGTWCGFEGDSAALDRLRPAFEAIGGRTFDIPAERKLVYHAASVMVSNYLNALVSSAIEAYGYAGIDEDTALELAAPILGNTLENILRRGPSASLTGPIARGDWGLVGKELETLRALDPALARIYRVLGEKTLALAADGGLLAPEDIERLEAILGDQATNVVHPVGGNGSGDQH
jgi:predicted short-subunit dehydrogenase-like oxidoreductase (DUF2520 family)